MEERATVAIQTRVETIRAEHVRFISDLARYNNEVSGEILYQCFPINKGGGGGGLAGAQSVNCICGPGTCTTFNSRCAENDSEQFVLYDIMCATLYALGLWNQFLA